MENIPRVLNKSNSKALRFDSHDDALNFARDSVQRVHNWVSSHSFDWPERYKKSDIEIVLKVRSRADNSVLWPGLALALGAALDSRHRHSPPFTGFGITPRRRSKEVDSYGMNAAAALAKRIMNTPPSPRTSKTSAPI